MDVGSSRIHLTAIAPPAAPRSAFGQIGTETDLPAPRVVQAAGEAEAADDATRPARPSVPHAEVADRRITIDEETREIVAQSLDAQTKRVIDQSPDRSMLALRAYFDRLSDAREARAAVPASGDGLELRNVVV